MSSDNAAPLGGEDRWDPARVQAIKERRAALLAGTKEHGPEASGTGSATQGEEDSNRVPLESRRYIIVRVGDERYGIPVADVESIKPVPALTAIPGAPAFMAGVISIVGRAITVIDLGRLVGASPSSEAASPRVVLFQVADEAVALRVDAVEGIREFESARSFVHSELSGSWLTPEQVTGVAEGTIRLLDCGNILRDVRLLVDQQPLEAL